MTESITHSQGIPESPSRHLFRPLNLAALFCVAFGLCLLCNIHPLGDGQWFWYSTLHHQGKRLYADFHLALQPFFILETEWNAMLFGDGWLVSKIPAVFHIVAFVAGLRWIAEYLPLRDWQKAILTLNAFFLATLFVAYRFDDYHVVADCFEIFSILLLLWLSRHQNQDKKTLATIFLLGILSGLSFTTRLNDGAFLLLTVVIAVAIILPKMRWLAIAVLLLAACGTILAVVGLTGDQFQVYSSSSIFQAAGSKGGLWKVLKGPVRLPFKTVQILVTSSLVYTIINGFVAVLCGLIAFYGIPFRKRLWSRKRALLCALPVILVTAFLMARQSSGDAAVALSGLFLLAGLFLALQISWQALLALRGRPVHDWSSSKIIFLVPIGQVLSASMSSGGVFIWLYAPIGVFLLLLPLALPAWSKRTPVALNSLFACATVMVLSTVILKVGQPYAWHTYIEPPMFANRQWYRHPLYGPMYIRGSQLDMVSRICKQIETSTTPAELLTLPFPYANYFCGIEPWHGYIQTFFDIVNAKTIVGLVHDLNTNPPHWILYQRQPRILELHEYVFNKGEPLPHRNLDVLIMSNLASGKWQKVIEQEASEYHILDWTATYFLINTRPEVKKVSSTEPPGFPNAL